MSNLTKEAMIEAGGKLWEKGSMTRVYFSRKEQIATIFNYAIVEKTSGMTPAGFDGMMKAGKTRSYFDAINNVFCADSGDIANAAREAGINVKRV